MRFCIGPDLEKYNHFKFRFYFPPYEDDDFVVTLSATKPHQGFQKVSVLSSYNRHNALSQPGVLNVNQL